jgi:hypothetical protein
MGQIKSRKVTPQKVINFTVQEANQYFRYYLYIPFNTRQTKFYCINSFVYVFYSVFAH